MHIRAKLSPVNFFTINLKWALKTSRQYTTSIILNSIPLPVLDNYELLSSLHNSLTIHPHPCTIQQHFHAQALPPAWHWDKLSTQEHSRNSPLFFQYSHFSLSIQSLALLYTHAVIPSILEHKNQNKIIFALLLLYQITHLFGHRYIKNPRKSCLYSTFFFLLPIT